MKIKPRIFKVDCGSYPFDILFCLEVKKEAILSHLKNRYGVKLSSKDNDALTMYGYGRTIMVDGGRVIMWFQMKDHADHMHGMIAHEVFHAVEMLFDLVGIGYNGVISGEAWAYQIDHITRQIYAKIGG